MNTETGFDIDWEKERAVEVDPEKFYQIYDKVVFDSINELRKSPAFRMLTGIKPT